MSDALSEKPANDNPRPRWTCHHCHGSWPTTSPDSAVRYTAGAAPCPACSTPEHVVFMAAPHA